MIQIITTIFHYEWLQLKRSRLLLLLLLCITACAAYAIYYGHNSISKQLKNIGLIEHINDSTKNTFYNYFKDKQLADSVKFGWAGMNSLYDGFTTEEFLQNNAAINYPQKLSLLAIGQRDVYPLYRKVTARSLYYDGSGISLDDKYAETSNPHKLLAGNFDISFVLIYLIPLLVIAFCYNLVAQEKETGTLSLLRNLPVSLKTITAVRFLFRFLVVLIPVYLYSKAGYLVSPVSTSSGLNELVAWLGISTAYLLFWFAVAWLCVSLQKNSSVTALLLTGCWILFLLIIPSFINNYISSNYKLSSRTALVKALNKQTAKLWDMPDSIQLVSFYKDFPQFAEDPVKPLWTETDSYDNLGKDETIDLRYNKKMLLWHYYLGKTVEQEVQQFNKQLEEKQMAAAKFSFINPAVLTNDLLNKLAASGQQQYASFRKATAAYRDNIFKRTALHVFKKRKLDLEQYKMYPAFDIDKYTANNNSKAASVWILVSYAFLFILFGAVIFNRIA